MLSFGRRVRFFGGKEGCKLGLRSISLRLLEHQTHFVRVSGRGGMEAKIQLWRGGGGGGVAGISDRLGQRRMYNTVWILVGAHPTTPKP